MGFPSAVTLLLLVDCKSGQTQQFADHPGLVYSELHAQDMSFLNAGE